MALLLYIKMPITFKVVPWSMQFKNKYPGFVLKYLREKKAKYEKILKWLKLGNRVILSSICVCLKIALKKVGKKAVISLIV